METKVKWIIAVILTALGLAFIIPVIHKKKGGDFLFLGDSQTASTVSSADLLKKEGKYNVDKVAKIGQTSKWALEQLQAYRGTYGTLVLFIGTNDIYSGVPAATSHKNIQAIVDLAKSKGANVIIYTIPYSKGYSTWTPTIHQKIVDLNKWIKGLSGVTVVDASAVASEGQGLKQGYTVGDHLHLNATAHKAVFAELKKHI